MDEKQFKEELERIAGEAKKEIGKIQDELKEALKGKADGKTISDLEAAMNGQTVKLDEALESMKEQGMLINAMKESGNNNLPPKAFITKALDKALSDNAEAIKSAAAGGQVAKIDIQKAATTIGSANIGDGVLQGLRLAGIEALDRNPNFIMNHITVYNGGIGSDPFSVVEKVYKEGGAATVAENAVKPYYDFTYNEKKRTAETIAVIVPVNKQALQKLTSLRNDILTEGVAELEEVLQSQIILGDNVSPNIDGIKNNAVAFDAGGLAASVQFANDYDVIRAVAAQVYRNRGIAVKILVHPDKIALMDLKKGQDGHYLLPPFVTADGMVVKGVRVMECFEMGTDEFLGGDLSKYMFNIVSDISMDIGLINDQFARNQLSYRFEMSGMGLVKAQHQNKLIKGDFTTAKAALLAAS